ncbi:hypothetical protein [Ancylobacter sp.]|uniref:hypothetical protein n=1 Tax=Ancylobacter sp. TaxID=1872567 RepID=UPI003D0B0C0C
MSKPPAPITFDEMIREAQQEAYRIEDIQAALVASGLRSGPEAQQLRRAKVFLAIASGLTDIRARQQQQPQGNRR